MAQVRGRVLIVDDDPAIREVEGDILEAAGFEVVRAADGQEAIDQLKADHVDLVLLDLLMPGIDGWGVLEFMRSMPEVPRVVLVSGVKEVVPPGGLAGCVAGYLCKPFPLDALTKTCDRVLTAAAPPPGAVERRRAPRRPFVAESILLSESGTPVGSGHLLDVSDVGFKVDFAIPVKVGDVLQIAFKVPGNQNPMTLPGRVRWRTETTIGVELESVSPECKAMLDKLTTGTKE